MSDFSKQLEDLNNTKDLPKDPALTVGATITTVFSALFLILKYVFPSIPEEVIQAAFTVAAILLPVVTSLFIRNKVWSPYSVQKITDEAVKKALETATVLKSPQLHQIATNEDVEKYKKAFFKDNPS